MKKISISTLKMKKIAHISLCDKYLLIKLGASIFLCVVAFMLLRHRYSDSLVTYVEIQENVDEISKRERCDLFVGEWVRYEGEPLYNKSCSFIVNTQNCIKNGRPDSGFLHWRWPRACDLPRFDPLGFLETMRNKSWAFVGDSLSRNHFESLMCMLSTVQQPTLLSHDEGNQTQKWFIPSFNITATLIWSPFLAKAIIPKDIYDSSPSEVHLHLDTLDPSWTDHYKTWDYTIFSSAMWYSRSAIYYVNNTVLGCHSCPKWNFTELGFESNYRRVMKSILNYIVESSHTGTTIYRTTTPDHFEAGEWYNGGACERKGPVKEGEFELSWLVRTLRDIEIEEFGEAYVRASQNGVKLRLLDVNGMSLMRPDGHPGVYTSKNLNRKDLKGKKVISDCLHWCLPGPIDSWNDVLMDMIVNSG